MHEKKSSTDRVYLFNVGRWRGRTSASGKDFSREAVATPCGTIEQVAEVAAVNSDVVGLQKIHLHVFRDEMGCNPRNENIINEVRRREER